jgi:hypothetical protein
VTAARSAAAAAAVALAAASSAGAEPHAPTRAAGPPTAVTVSLGRPRPAIARRFLGLSFEARDLPGVARLATRGDLVALLRSLGPGTLRFGGNSVDATTAWYDGQGRRPRWARVLVSPRDLDGIARLARATGWNVLLAVTLGHPDPAAAAREVAAARARLGSALAGVEIGNEPDQYVSKRLRRRPWGYSRYRAEVARYRAAIAAAAPGVPLAGPDLASAKPSRWLAAYARRERPSLLTAHFYPLIRCGHDRPTISRLMSPDLRLSEQRVLDRLARLAARSHRPMRIGETNNVACSGQPGVSDTYASALWALDYLVRAVYAGVSGVNFHGFLAECRTYTPLCARSRPDLAAGRLAARPEWYALLAARSLAGARPLTTGVTPTRRDLTAIAVRSPRGGIDAILVNLGARPIRVALRVPPRLRTRTLIRMTGPSLSARSGVRLGARAVDPHGGWSAAGARLPARRDALTVTLGAFSAAVVSARP